MDNELVSFFKENDINPYKLLGVSKKTSEEKIKDIYNKKIKKNKNNEIQLKILEDCYTYIISKVNISIKKCENKVDKEESIFDKNFYSINFDKNEIRKKIFVDDGLDFDNFSNDIEDKKKNPKNYSNIKESNYKNIFKNEKFNLDKFNAVFETTKPKEENSEEVSGFSFSSVDPFYISSDRGLIIEKKTDPTDYMKFLENDTFDLTDLKNLDEYNEDDLSKIIKKKKKDMKPLSVSYMNKLKQDKKNEDIIIDTSKNFSRVDEVLNDIKSKDIKRENENNRNDIFINMKIYPEHIVSQYKEGVLEDSGSRRQ